MAYAAPQNNIREMIDQEMAAVDKRMNEIEHRSGEIYHQYLANEAEVQVQGQNVEAINETPVHPPAHFIHNGVPRSYHGIYDDRPQDQSPEEGSEPSDENARRAQLLARKIREVRGQAWRRYNAVMFALQENSFDKVCTLLLGMLSDMHSLQEDMRRVARIEAEYARLLLNGMRTATRGMHIDRGLCEEVDCLLATPATSSSQGFARS